jgi:hypothetical protein
MTAPQPMGQGLAGQTRFMPPASVSILLSALTIYGNHLATNNEIKANVVVGGGFVIIVLAVINTMSTGMADVFALLLFIVIFLKYGPAVLTAIGIATQGGQ